MGRRQRAEEVRDIRLEHAEGAARIGDGSLAVAQPLVRAGGKGPGQVVGGPRETRVEVGRLPEKMHRLAVVPGRPRRHALVVEARAAMGFLSSPSPGRLRAVEPGVVAPAGIGGQVPSTFWMVRLAFLVFCVFGLFHWPPTLPAWQLPQGSKPRRCPVTGSFFGLRREGVIASRPRPGWDGRSTPGCWCRWCCRCAWRFPR